VSTICVGMAMSMGAILLAGGAPGKRYALPNAKIMIHQGSGGFRGSPTDIDIHAREVLAMRRRMAEIIAEHTGHPIDQVEKDMDRDRFMTAEEARDYGVIDEVFTSRKLRPLAGPGALVSTRDLTGTAPGSRPRGDISSDGPTISMHRRGKIRTPRKGSRP
jgi:ATP-dependent Clp protease protease subunit